jgi:hypothetical protein
LLESHSLKKFLEKEKKIFFVILGKKEPLFEGKNKSGTLTKTVQDENVLNEFLEPNANDDDGDEVATFRIDNWIS